ncbi:MAG: DUF1080 domain-containing protein [Niabella sp.]
MKHKLKYISCLFVSLLLSVIVMAQAPQNRAKTTIVADVLAQLPAQHQPQYNQLMTDLVSTGEEGLLNLIGRLNPPGDKSNEAMDYAISGWTNFVANDAAKSEMAAATFAKALNMPVNDEIKALLIRQLEQIGTEKQMDVLVPLLNNERLAGPASQALAHFNSRKADAALATALAAATADKLRTQLVNALLQTRADNIEPALLETLSKTSDPVLQGAVYTALGKFGSSKALPVLQAVAVKENYVYGKQNATGAYLDLLNKLSASDTKTVQRNADLLYKAATASKNSGLQIASMNILSNLPGQNKAKLLETALKSGNASLLTSLLAGYGTNADSKTMKLLLKNLRSSNPGIQTAIAYWLGSQGKAANVSDLSRLLRTDNDMLQTAVIRSLAKTSGKEALASLGGLLKSDNSATVAKAAEALSTSKDDISALLSSAFDDCGDEGKKAILQLIASRKMESQYDLVYKQMSDNNAAIKAEAAKTLKSVVTDKNLPDIFTLLEQSDATYIPGLQDAANAALANLPASKQIQLVSDKMKPSSKKQLYYKLLANSGDASAMDILTKAYATGTGANKTAVIEALDTWKAFDAIYPLLDIARNTASTNEKAAAVNAIIEKISSSNQTGAVKYLFLRDALELSVNDNQRNTILRLLGATNTYQAMLLAGNYLDNATVKENAAVAAMNLALNNPAFAGQATTTILNKVKQTLSNPDAGYQRQSIDKYLAENKKDGGFVSIFNGKNLDGWKGLVKNPIERAKMSKKDLAAAQQKADKEAVSNWIVENGALVFTGHGDNLCTDKQYGDFEMLVDWKLYPGSEPDAGIYLRGTPQVQIWDTSRVNVGAQVGSGGLYNNQVNQSKPLKVSDLKLGEWNTFRIKMIGDRVSVWLNGDLVVDNVILENYWDRSQPIFPMEQIELQAHGSKVAYRDIYIKEIPRPEPFKLSKEEEKEGFKTLFDGTNMHAWTGNTKDYILEDGNIVMHPSNSFGGNLYTKDEFGNFIFRFEFMLTPGANNGLGIRTPMEGDAAYEGMELQILDNDAPIYKDLEQYQYHGSVYGVIPAKTGFLKPTGEWNYQEVIANGDHIKITLNGTTILDGNIREASKNGTQTADHKQHPGLLNPKGHIGFLGHGSEVKFRNIRIKELR